MTKLEELQERLMRFMECFQAVFDNHWEFSKDAIKFDAFIAGTFLNPGMGAAEGESRDIARGLP